MRKCLYAIVLAMLFPAASPAEVVRWEYKSPDGKRLVKVNRVSEAPDFTVTVTQDDRTLWKYHPDPEDKSVRIFWHPGSNAFLMEHVTQQADYRLYIISIFQDHVELFPITIERTIHPAAIVDGTVVWDKFENGVRIISLTVRDRDSKQRKMQIAGWRKLEQAEDKGPPRKERKAPKGTP